MIKPITISVVTHGDFPRVTKQCLDSIVNNCPRDQYNLFVGANVIGEATMDYLNCLVIAKQIDYLIVSQKNLFKCGMSRRLFAEIETEFIWQFDDDSYITDSGAFGRWLSKAQAAPAKQVVWGHIFYYSKMADWCRTEEALPSQIQKAPWNRNKPRTEERWWFPTGGCWLGRTSAIRQLDLPPAWITWQNAHEDVLMGEAIRQQDLEFVDTKSDGVRINSEPTRTVKS